MLLYSAPVMANEVIPSSRRILTLLIFGLLIASTLIVTYWTAKKTHSVGDFYAAGGNISGVKNGFAIAGDFLSAAAFLG